MQFETMEKTHMDMSWMAEDMSKPGVKVWHLKSPVIDIWLAREAATSIRMGEAFLLLMHKKTGHSTFH